MNFRFRTAKGSTATVPAFRVMQRKPDADERYPLIALLIDAGHPDPPFGFTRDDFPLTVEVVE